jgi:hypothetical protein
LEIEVLDASGAPLPAVEVKIYRGGYNVHKAVTSFNQIRIEKWHDLELVTVESLAPGSWMASLQPPFRSGRLTLKALPNGPIGWWHHLIGLKQGERTRGSGVTVGVVDKVFERRADDKTLDHVTVLGANDRPKESRMDKGLLPEFQHGTSIASLMFSRTDVGFGGIAPGATAYFYAARIPGYQDLIGSDRKIATGLIANGIQELSQERLCDIISVSAGDMIEDRQFLHRQIIKAQDNGTLCFFGAGNEGGELLYPARYPEVLSVGAIGKKGFAPRDTYEYKTHEEPSTSSVAEDYYLWVDSATGKDLKFVAPGSNIVWSHGDLSATAVSGTSWAAPSAAATAAVILSEAQERWKDMPRNIERWREMLTILGEHSDTLGLPKTVVEHGLLRRWIA